MDSLELQPDERVKNGFSFPLALKQGFVWLALSFSCFWLIMNGSTDFLQRFLIVAFLVLVVVNKGVRRDPLVLGSVLVIVFLTLQFLLHRATVPEVLFADRFPAKYLYFSCFFLVLAYATILWKRISPFLILIGSAVGLVAFLLIYSSGNEWGLSWQGGRVEFGFRNAQHAGIFFGTGLLGIVFFAHRVMRVSGALAKPLAVLGTFCFAALMVYGILVTQVRAVWLALILAMLTGLMLYLLTIDLRAVFGRLRFKHLAWTVVAIAGLSFLSGGLQIHARVLQRIEQERINVQTVEEAARLEGKHSTSTGIRIALWAASVQWIEERPLLGWGNRTAENLIQADTRFDAKFKQEFGHLHNSFLELLVAMGTIGLFALGGLLTLFVARVVKAHQAGGMPRDVFLFAWTFLVFWAVVNCFESYINYATGFYVNSVIAGFLYAFCLQQSAPEG
jgi:O-antigen ligase